MHSCIYVLINGEQDTIESSVDAALEPFDEALEVPPYKDRLSHSSIRFMAEQYKLAATDLHRLAGKMPDWRGVPGGVDELGLFDICTSNPDGKWDWYEIGGRWNGFITGRKRPNKDLIQNNCIIASKLLKSPDFSKRLPAAIVTGRTHVGGDNKQWLVCPRDTGKGLVQSRSPHSGSVSTSPRRVCRRSQLSPVFPFRFFT